MNGRMDGYMIMASWKKIWADRCMNVSMQIDGRKDLFYNTPTLKRKEKNSKKP